MSTAERIYRAVRVPTLAPGKVRDLAEWFLDEWADAPELDDAEREAWLTELDDVIASALWDALHEYAVDYSEKAAER